MNAILRIGRSGGVIRTLVWDWLHDDSTPTPLNDIDVAYFDPTDLQPDRDLEIERVLYHLLPKMPWQARNQAAVHLWYERKFGFPVEPLSSSADGIGTWTETATNIAVRLLDNDELLMVAPCGMNDLFEMVCRRNPRRVTEQIFEQRLADKQIVKKWPKVRVIHDYPREGSSC
ncbi:nucleotidyltransferase family protein [Ferroacidibacillus organovorans]|uniref:nucleotidyltransferase family protein n=1 Tax=Ferroacidibacillus organovorans TaxID=1765683 RepID=UPI000830D232|nr:nucleotidyltransferase family protein [Ferroacidibacillus organovorans]